MFTRDLYARKGYQMRYRITFLAGLAVGFVAGTRAGRERYEQMVKIARKTAENPTVQKVTRAAGQKAADLGKAAKDKTAEQMPGRHAASQPEGEHATVNGTRPVD